MSCPTPDTLLAFSGGALLGAAAARVDDHLDGCRPCRLALIGLVQSRSRQPTDEKAAGTTDLGWSQLLAPDSVVDRYRITQLIGIGGMGEVYLARDIELGRKVALKRLRPSAEGRERLLAEARITARFNHPHIVTLYGVSEHAGRLLVALEYVEGQTLRARMDREKIAVAEIPRIATAVAMALVEAAQHQVVHCDLKPSNVMLGSDGRVRVLDFGLARPVSSAHESGGTPSAMAPEQWQKQPLTAAVDVWAFGVLLFELLHGQRPFTGELPQLRQAICHAPPVTVPEPRADAAALHALALRCLAKAPAERPVISEVLADLRRATGGGLAPETDPFPGLAAYREAEHPFLGRDAEVARCIEHLRHQATLCVVGPSGIGKSSFVRAGLVPRWRERGPLTVLDLRPGPRPFERLAQAVCAALSLPAEEVEPWVERHARLWRHSPSQLHLALHRVAASTASNVLVFVDPLEELRTAGSPLEELTAFLGALTSAADATNPQLRVVLACREDFLSEVLGAADGGLGSSEVAVLGALGAAALERVFRAPFEDRGYRFEPESLVTQVVAGIIHQPAALPLLQVVCQRLWARRDARQRVIDLATLEAEGGVSAAFAQWADSVLDGLTSSQVADVRALMLRLVAPHGTRQVVSEQTLLDGMSPTAHIAYRRLVDARLLIVSRSHAGSPEVEMAHESLAIHWGTLGRWLDESRQHHALLHEVEQAAALWERRGTRDDEVWPARAVADVRSLLNEHAVSAGVQRFLLASEKLERKQRQRRRALIGVGLAAWVFITLGSLGFAALLRQRQLEAQARAAEAQREGATAAWLRGDLLEARARVRTALELHDSAPTRMLWTRLQREPQAWNTTVPATLFCAAWSPDGTTLAVGADREVVLLDAATGQVKRTLTGHGAPVFSARYSSDGRWLATGDFAGKLRLWPLGGGQPREVAAHAVTVWGIAFLAGDTQLVTVGNEGARLWNTQTLQPVGELKLAEGAYDLALSPDGSTVALAGGKGGLMLWKPGQPQPPRLEEGPTRLSSVAWSPDGSQLATGDVNGRVRIWDVASQKRVAQINAHGAPVNAVAFGRGVLVSASQDRMIRVWNLQTYREVQAFREASAVWEVNVSPDGDTVAAATVNQRVSTWKLGVEPWNSELGHSAEVGRVVVSPDGKTVASGGVDRHVRIWDVATGVSTRLEGHQATVWDVAFSPDGRYLASSSEDQTAKLWNVSDGHLVRTLQGHAGTVYGVAFSADGLWAATTCKDGKVRVWEVESGRLLQVLSGHPNGEFRAAFSPDGAFLVSIGSGSEARLWETRSWKPRSALGAVQGALSVGFIPKKPWVMLAGRTGIRILELPHGTERWTWNADFTVRTAVVASERVAVLGEGGQVAWLDVDGKELGRTSLPNENALDLGVSGDGQLLAIARLNAVQVWNEREGRIAWLPPAGKGASSSSPASSTVGSDGVTAVAQVGQTVLKGNQSGNVWLNEAATATPFPMTPKSAVVQLALSDTVVAAGFADGWVGVWDRGERTLMASARLNGPVSALQIEPRQLTATSTLGSRFVFDLSILSQSRCEVLKQVRADVPGTWRDGQLERQANAFDTACE